MSSLNASFYEHFLAPKRSFLGISDQLPRFNAMWAWALSLLLILGSSIVAQAAPSPPATPSYSNKTATGLRVTAPALPTGATSLTLQRKLTSQADTSYVQIASGQAGSSFRDETGLTVNTSYTYRYIGVGSSGSTPGTAAAVTTLPQPSAAGAPTISALKSTTLTATAPALPANTSSLTLQRKSTSEADTAYVNVATGIAGSGVTNVTNLTPSTGYSFRYLSVSGTATTAGTAATPTTLPPPGVASAPTISAVTSISLTATAPTLPTNTDTLTLYRKLSTDPDTSYASLGTQTAGSNKSVTGLSAGNTYVFRYVATSGTASTSGNTVTVTTVPSTPAAPTFTANSPTAVTVTTPAFPAGVTSFTLQRKITTASDTTYTNIATNIAANTAVPVTGLTLNTGYSFRCLGVWSGGTVTGTAAAMTTLAEAPDNLEFVSRTATSVRLSLPLLPQGAASLNVQKKLAADPDTSYVNILTGSGGGIQTDVTSLTASTAYSFRCVSVNTGGTNPGAGLNVSTSSPAPGAPAAPTLSGTTATQVTATAPALPANATSLTLQRKLTSDPDSAYINLATGLLGTSVSDVTGLISATSYSFRYLAVNDGASVAGTAASVTTGTSGAAPGVASAPTFTAVQATSLKALAPSSLPANTNQLTLQQKLTAEADTAYHDVADGLSANSVSLVNDLLPSTSYSFRYVARGQNNGATAGTAATVATSGGLPGWPGVPEFGSYTDTTAQVHAPILPAGATSLTLFQKLKNNPLDPFVAVATGVAGGGTVNVSGLTASTAYTFYFAAVNANGSTPGSPAYLTTAPTNGLGQLPPDVPGSVTIDSIEDNTIWLSAPALPANAASMILQRKNASEPDASYRNIYKPYSGGPALGLKPGTTYIFRVVAVGTYGQTAGAGVSATTTENTTVGKPRFGNIATTSVVVLAPPLPAGATSLTLQKDVGGTFTDVATGLAGGSSTTVSGLSASNLYSFRYVAVKAGGNIEGEAEYVETPSSNTTIAIPVSVAVFPDRIQIKEVSNRSLYWKKASDSDYYYEYADYNGGRTIWTNQGNVKEFAGLEPNTAYSFRLSNGYAVSPTLTVTTTLPPAPLPATPSAPTVVSANSGAVTFSIPSIPANTSYLELQYQLNDAGAFYTEAVYYDPKEFFASASNYVFTPQPGSNYSFRWVAVGAGGRTYGPETPVVVAAGPDVPGLPTVVSVATTSVTITMPALPAGATSLRLQKNSPYAPESSYADISISGSTTIAGGATVTATGLTSNTEYNFRVVAVADSRTNGNAIFLTTLTSATAPTPPGTPSFSSTTSTSVTVTMPALPAGADTLTLQMKDTINGAAFAPSHNFATGLAGGAIVNVTGLSPATSYLFRVLAVNSSGSTPSLVTGMTTEFPAPGLPSFSNLTNGSVDVTSPALPAGAIIQTLHVKVTGQSDETYHRVSDRLFGGVVTSVTGLQRNTSYTFRYIAYSSYSTVLGPTATVTTLNAADVWVAGPPISCNGISWPLAGATLPAGSQGVLNAFRATDWDMRTPGMTSNGLFSDSCNYTWSATGGSFKDGNNKGQQPTWIAPLTPGTYTLTLVVDDQNGANVANNETGSRKLNPVGANDDPLTFTVSVTVY